MTTQSITSVTEGQRKQIKRFVEDAVDRAIAEGLLDKDSVQKLIESGDKFQARVVAVIRELSASEQLSLKELFIREDARYREEAELWELDASSSPEF